MYQILKQIAVTGIKTEPPPHPDERLRTAREQLHGKVLQYFSGALTIRHVDAGSCNGCELEINSLNNPYYNLEGLGIKFVASPRHADMLLVTGPVSRHMEIALKRHTGSETGSRTRRLRLHRRHFRRKLCELRPGIERDSGRRRGAGLSADAVCDHAGDTDRDLNAHRLKNST